MGWIEKKLSIFERTSHIVSIPLAKKYNGVVVSDSVQEQNLKILPEIV